MWPRRLRFDREEFKQRLAAREGVSKAVGPGATRRFGEASVRALPDGLSEGDLHVNEFAQLFRADQLAALETKEEILAHATIDQGMDEIWTSSARLVRGPDGRLFEAVAFEVHDVYTERTTWTTNADASRL